MLLVSVLSTAALAQEPAFYHPAQVAEQSTLFAKAAEASAPQFQAAQDTIRSYSLALEELEVGTLMAASRLDTATLDRSASLRREVMGRFMQTSAHSLLLQTDYDQVFTESLQRALSSDLGDYQVIECGATGVAALTGHSNCEGVDLNQELASRIDADSTLASQVDEINSVPWPELTMEFESQDSTPLLGGGGGDLIYASVLSQRFISHLIEIRQDDLDRALASLEDGLESGVDEDLARAQELRAEYEAKVGADGSLLLAAVEASLTRLAKKNDLGAISLCVNPTTFGGCEGPDQSSVMIQLLESDRKFLKAVAQIEE